MRKKGSVYRSMLVSYILILFIPVAISIGLYKYTYEIVRSQTEEHTKNLMSTLNSTCDREFEFYKNTLKDLYVSEEVRDLLSTKVYDAQKDSWKTYQVQKEVAAAFNNLLSHAPNCKGLFIYLKTADKVIGQGDVASLDLYGKMRYEGDIDQFRAFLQEADSDSMFYYKTTSGKEYILMVETLIKANGRRADAIAGVWISTEDLDTKVGSNAWQDGVDWTIIKDSGILREIKKFPIENPNGMEKNVNSSNALSINGVNYFIHAADSEVVKLQYMLFTPERIITESVNRIRNMHLISLFIIMIFGIFFAKRFVEKHYNPLKRLSVFFDKHGRSEGITDEYQYLEQQISGLIDVHENVREDAKKKKRILRGYALEALIANSVIEREKNEFYEEIYHKFEKGYNLVLLCGIMKDYNAENYQENVVGEKNLKRFIISNVYGEGIGAVYKLEALELSEQVAFIINVPSEEKGYSEVLQEIIEKLYNLIADKFGFTVYSVEGKLYSGIEGIHKSYLDACDAESFLHYIDENYIRYEDIQDLSVHKYDYSFEMEERITNAIREHNVKLAISYVNSILDSNFNRRNECPPEMLTCLLYDVFGTLLKAGEEQGLKNNRLLTMSHISAESSIEELKNFYQQMIEEMCKDVSGCTGNERSEELCRSILEYIKENYMDPDLNVSQTALHFGITPSYLTAIFKKQTGQSIFEALRQERISNAQRLLESGMNVADVAVQVGFRERTTFIRTFKNSTGITPGSVKKIK